MVVPIKLATTTLRIEVGIPVFSPPIRTISASLEKIPLMKVYRHAVPCALAHGLLTPDQDPSTLSRPADTGGMELKGHNEHIFDLEQPRTKGMPIHPAHRQAGYSYL